MFNYWWRAPEPLSGYGGRVWRRIEERVSPRRRASWFGVARWTWATAAAGLVAVAAAFYLGRALPPAPVGQPDATAFSAASRQSRGWVRISDSRYVAAAGSLITGSSSRHLGPPV